jgi:predicted acetyltransferase
MMSATVNDTSSVVYRPIQHHEEQQVIDLRYAAFGTMFKSGYCDRCFIRTASPRYKEGDTLGAWCDGKLVSTAHIRRLIIRSVDDNIEYRCGGIVGVATLEEYRKRGYSRQLLRMAIEKMEQSNEFDVSFLQTETTKHYRVLGWEQICTPSPITVEWKNLNFESNNFEWQSAIDLLSSDGQFLLEIHSDKPRAYQFDRSPLIMFEHCTGWNWSQERAIVCMLKGEQTGYIVINHPDDYSDVYISEWRAPNVEVEKKLFELAAKEIRRRHPDIKYIRFYGLPQYMSLEKLEELYGRVTKEQNDVTMVRNIRLPNHVFDRMKISFTSGESILWPGDYF